MWIYEQLTGRLRNVKGELIGVGYSGNDIGKNNPDLQDMRDTGPIPIGTYSILRPHDDEKHGPYVLPLSPNEGDEMFGRDGFLIHGDSINHPGMASLGCIVMAFGVRKEVWESGDHQLCVVDGKPHPPGTPS